MRKLRVAVFAVVLVLASGLAQASGIHDSHAILRGAAGGNNIGTCHITQTGEGEALLRVSVKSNLTNPMQIFDADEYLLDYTTSAMSTETFVQWVYTSRLNLSAIHVVVQSQVPPRSTDEKFFEAVAKPMSDGRVLGSCQFEQIESE